MDTIDHFFARIAVAILVVLALGQLCAGCQQATVAVAIAIDDTEAGAAAYPSAVVPPAAITIAPERVSLDVPDRCDPLVIVERDGTRRLSKQLPAWFASEAGRAQQRARIRRVVEIVADEMGADELAVELLWRKAISESSANAGAVHVLSPDIEANETFARRGIKLSSDRWKRAAIPVHEKRRGELVVVDELSAWAIGRGLLGMNTGLYMARWSTDAPPWSLCTPEIALVTAIWSIRYGQRRCKDSSLRFAYRWISAGQCGPRAPDKERRFDRLARGNVRGLKLPSVDARADVDFGDRWPQDTADRGELLAVLQRRLAEEL